MCFMSGRDTTDAMFIVHQLQIWTLMTLRIVLSGEDLFEEDLSKRPTLSREKQALKWI